MAASVQIRCINKTDRYNPWERISHVGGVNPDGTRWRLSLDAAIRGVEDGTWHFWVSVAGDRVDVEIAESRFGNKYLKTENDGDEPNNLLSLPGCPV